MVRRFLKHTLRTEKESGKDLRDAFHCLTSGMSVDVKLLDNDHKKLAILINDLHDGVMTGCARSRSNAFSMSLSRIAASTLP